MAKGAADTAYKYLYDGILSEKFMLGSPIVEDEIADALGLSRSPVREALKRMEAEGLVSHYASRGTFVMDFTKHDLEEIFDLRYILELYALNKAYKFIDDDVLDRLEQTFLALNENSHPQQFYDANRALHSTIVAYGGNKRLEKFYNMLSAQQAIVNRISSRDPEHFSVSKKKHLEIIRALQARDLERARYCLSEHLKEVKERTIGEFLEPSIKSRLRSLV